MNSLASWLFPDAEDLRPLHADLLTRYGGLQGVTPGCVEGSVGSAKSASLYLAQQDGEPDLVCAAAHLLVYLAKNHCFTDGNKRIAMAAAWMTFSLNGIQVNADQDEVAHLVEKVAEGKLTAQDVMVWFTQPGRLVASSDAAQVEPIRPEASTT